MAEAKKPAEYVKPEYTSKYQGKLDEALGNVTNRQDFTYDPLKDANYQAIAKVYQKQGEQAAQNTLGDAAALTGGYGSSYAVTASQQARNDYNQQLASQIPALQEAAYNRYLNNYNMDVTALNALRDAEDSDYGKYRDTVSDSQWDYSNKYQQYRDEVGDNQWQQGFDRDKYESDRAYNYQVGRDKVTDSQWAKEFALQKKSAAASSRGRASGRSSSSSNGYKGYGTTGGDYNNLIELYKGAGSKGFSTVAKSAADVIAAAAKKAKKK